MNNNKPIPVRELLWQLSHYIRPYRRWLILATLASLLKVAVDIGMAYLIQNITEGAQQGLGAPLGKFLSVMAALALAGVAINYLCKSAAGRFSMYALRDLHGAIVDRIEKMSMASYDRIKGGDLTSRLSKDEVRLRDFLEADLMDLCYQPLILLSAIMYLMLLSLKLLLLNILIWTLVFGIASGLTGWFEKWTKEILEQYGTANGIAKDVIDGFMVVKAFNLGEVMAQKYSRAIGKVFAREMKFENYISFLTPFFLIIGIVPSLLCFFFGGYLVARGEMALSSLLTFVFLLNFLMAPVGRIPAILQNFNMFRGAAQRVLELLEFPKEQRAGQTVSCNGTRPLEFEDVVFTYPGAADQVLKGVSFNLQPGKILALVGASGSGKSTITRLICGFYPPDAGRIKLYGHDLAVSDPGAVRKLLAFVPQQSYFFPATISENIACGKWGATSAEVVAAARLAHIHDEILGLPLQYDTVIGDGGLQLSGGQLQRLSLARAIIKQTPLLILDEPTAALDSQTEMLIRDTLIQYARQGRGILMVTHRFSTISIADQIIVLDRGRISESGSHQQLINNYGLYRQLYQKQYAGASTL